MQLTINGQTHSENPSEDELNAAVANLGEEGFRILSSEDQRCIQTLHNEDGTYQPEYRGGSADRHVCVDPQPITIDDVTQAIVMYRNDSGSLAEKWNWEKLDLG